MLYLRQFRIPDMGCASYLVGSQGQALVIDPQWRIEPYLKVARKEGLEIVGAVDTHLHADHVSGNRRLAAEAGATVYLHEDARASFEHTALKAGQVLNVGDVELEVLHTPGHTGESIVLKVTDRTAPENHPILLTGDTLFIGDVGRPDLAGAEGAAQLFESLKTLAAFPDETVIYPAHLSGSLCGRSLSKAHSCTLGRQRQFNEALKMDDREAFIHYLMDDVPPHPADFERIIKLNRNGPPVEIAAPRELSLEAVKALLDDRAQLLDVRDPAEFWQGHPAGALNVPVYSNHFGPNMANFINRETKVVLVAEDQTDAQEAVELMANVGRSQVRGFINPVLSGELQLAREAELTTPEFNAVVESGTLAVLDVRQPGEYAGGSVPHSLNVPLQRLNQPEILEVVRQFYDQARSSGRELVVMCGNGNRSSVAASYLRGFGIKSRNLVGGYNAYQESKVLVA
jgi:hydroxyacylglutathione hydrolase